MKRRFATSLILVILAFVGTISVTYAGGGTNTVGCTQAKEVPRETPDVNFSVKGPAVVEVWYPDASENGMPSWGDDLRKVYVPAKMRATFLDAQGFTWKWTNTKPNRQCSKEHFAANQNIAVSRSTLVAEHVARFVWIS